MYFDQTAFGRRLQDLRKENHLTQEQAAEQLNVSKIHYANIEGGRKGCSVDLLLDLSEMYRVTVDYLLKGNNTDHEMEIARLKAAMSEANAILERL